jgi:hypothetical protein
MLRLAPSLAWCSLVDTRSAAGGGSRGEQREQVLVEAVDRGTMAGIRPISVRENDHANAGLGLPVPASRRNSAHQLSKT